MILEYETVGTGCTMPCPHGKSPMLGSGNCKRCPQCYYAPIGKKQVGCLLSGAFGSYANVDVALDDDNIHEILNN